MLHVHNLEGLDGTCVVSLPAPLEESAGAAGAAGNDHAHDDDIAAEVRLAEDFAPTKVHIQSTCCRAISLLFLFFRRV